MERKQPERVDHLLRRWGICTKAEARELAAQGRITVDGIMIENAGAFCPAGGSIAIDGTPVQPRPALTVMLNKPAGYVCMKGDPKNPCVLELLRPEDADCALFCVGRLDRDTEGLLLLTNDGALAARITDPGQAVEKTYYAEFSRPLPPDATGLLAAGIQRFGHTYRPARLQLLSDRSALITVTEGKFHEVRRLIGACHAYVTALRRVSVGGLALDEALTPGSYRPLTETELYSIFHFS